MIATNTIKINGVWYQAGDELPDDRAPILKPVLSDDDGKQAEEPKEASVTRKDIEEMKYFSLKSLAEKNGISTKGKKANVLRKEVIEALGL